MIKRIPKTIRGLFYTGLICLFFFYPAGISTALEDKEEEVITEVKEVQGEVSSLTPRINPQYIGVTYKEEQGVAYEIVLCIDEDLELAHKRDLTEIGIGDTVDITYHEITETAKDGKQRTMRVAKNIRFVRPADNATLMKYGLVARDEFPAGEQDAGQDAGYETEILRAGEKIKGYRGE
ncbi:hypothetical protein ACFL5X_03530 [Candidatus Omnitrophota bacterium]